MQNSDDKGKLPRVLTKVPTTETQYNHDKVEDRNSVTNLDVEEGEVKLGYPDLTDTSKGGTIPTREKMQEPFP